MTTANTLNS